jgi:hypothetical protein
MHRPRYVVVSESGRWRIRQAGRRFPASFSSKTQALGAAIAFAEKDIEAGRVVEVMVRHEDDHFVTEWAYGGRTQMRALPIYVE